jgi:hypothetical protein
MQSISYALVKAFFMHTDTKTVMNAHLVANRNHAALLQARGSHGFKQLLFVRAKALTGIMDLMANVVNLTPKRIGTKVSLLQIGWIKIKTHDHRLLCKVVAVSLSRLRVPQKILSCFVKAASLGCTFASDSKSERYSPEPYLASSTAARVELEDLLPSASS